MLYRPSRYTRQDGTGVSVASNVLISFMLTHFLNQIVKALVMLRLRNCTVLQKTIEQSLLFQEQLMILLGVGKRGPFFDFNIHNNHRA